MQFFKALLIFLIGLSHFRTQAEVLKLVFWIEEDAQKGINDDIARVMEDIKKIGSGVDIQDAIVEMHDEDFEYSQNAMTTFCNILSTEGVSVVIDLTYRSWQDGLNFLTSRGIPFLRVGRFISPFLRMFGDFLSEKGGNDVVLIFQNEQDKSEALYDMVDGFPFRAILINGLEDKTFVKRLLALRPSPTYYGVFANGTNMNSLFEKIYKGKLFARPEEWHFIFLDSRERLFKHASRAINSTKLLANITSVCSSMPWDKSSCLSKFTYQRVILFEIFRTLIEFKKSNENNLKSLQFSCDGNGNEFSNQRKPSEDFLSKLPFKDFISIVMNDVDTNGEIKEEPILTYKLNVSISTYSKEANVAKELAVWEEGELIKINETISRAKRFFRIGTAEAIPWSYYRRDKRTQEIMEDERGNPIWEGYCIDFIETLAEKLNFDFEIVEPKKGKFGERDPHTKRWDGIIGDMVTGEIDFAVAALKMYSEREEVVDFIAPYFEQTGISIVMRKPVRQTSLFKFMTVLRLEVWLSIIAALVATAIMIWLLDKYSPYSSRNNPSAYPYPCREFTLRESFWFALTSFTPQGGGEAPKAVSGRILVAAYWLFVVLMLATFTANLAAFLTVERMQTPVQNLDQLARQSRINYTVVADSDTHHYFINMKFAEDTLYRMWKELALNASDDFHKFRIWDYPIKEQYGHILLAINASEPVRNAAEGFQKVNEHENADFAFIHDSSEIKYEITQNCNLTEVGEVFAEQPYAIAVQQGSHLTDEFSFAILELQKDRYFEDLKAKYWNHSLTRECSISEDQEGITLESLGGVFIATLFGLGLAMITLAIEVFYYKRLHAKKLLQSKNKITEVKPIEQTAEGKKSILNSWFTDQSSKTFNTTPPPSFESATYFRGRKVPPSITLGGEDFKPRRIAPRRNIKDIQKSNEKNNEGFLQKDSTLPSYME